MNHRVATLKLRGALLTACGGLVASCVFACGGDDVTPPPGDDSGSETSTPVDSGSDAKADSTTPGLDATPDVAVDVSVDVTPDVKLDAVVDVQPDVRPDVALDAPIEATLPDASDGGSADADGGPAPLVPLDLCPTLDTDYAITAPDDRVAGWSDNISGASAPYSFALALTGDCNVNGISSVFTGADGPNGTTAYFNQLNAWTLQFFGCPLDDSGALSFAGLIPAGAAGHVFTLADLNELSSLFVNATISGASLFWGANYPTANAQPLTAEQIDQIQSQLSALANAYPGVNKTSSRLTYSTCDAGAGPGDGGGEAGSDGGADAGSD